MLINLFSAKLSSSSNHKVKCPYCPVEQNPGEARRLVFWLEHFLLAPLGVETDFT